MEREGEMARGGEARNEQRANERKTMTTMIEREQDTTDDCVKNSS